MTDSDSLAISTDVTNETIANNVDIPLADGVVQFKSVATQQPRENHVHLGPREADQ